MAGREDDVQTVPVRDDLCKRIGCQLTWSLGNQFFLYAGQERSNALAFEPQRSAEQGAVCDVRVGEVVQIHEVKWDTDMHGPLARKLVNETHDIFMNLQQAAQDTSAKPHMLKYSREYRSVLRACIMDMQASLAKEDSNTEMETRLQLFEVIELIWNLCEILFVETLPGGVVVLQLLDWLRMHFVAGLSVAQECLRDEYPEEHPSYWQAVKQLVLQGSVEEARRLLSAHSSRDQSILLMDQLLKTMPVFTAYPGHSLAEFEIRWRHWQEECTQRLRSGEFVSNKHLETLCRILCGEDEVFVEERGLMGNWYCMLISRLLYQSPTVKAYDLQYHTQFCIAAYGGNTQLQPCDSILLAALEFDVHQVIKESSCAFSNWWFVAHLTDLLHHCGKLQSQTLYYGSNLREFLLLEYSSSLMSHPSLWQLGVDYLDNCPEFGRYYLEQYIEHLALETDRKANKVLYLCEQRHMQDQIHSICKSMGMKALHNLRLGSALSWALRSKDAAFVSFLAEKFLDQYSENGGFSNIDLLDNLGSTMLLSGKLTFLGKYREFHKLYQDGDFQAAASLLLSLLTAKVAPRKFWLILLTDALPLLEATELIFDSQQTYELMHCLEELSVSQKLAAMDSESTQVVSEVEKEKQDLMKLALARNLARAIVQEGTVAI